MTIFWWVLAAILVLVGIVGTVLPALPGVPLVFAGLTLAAYLDDFNRVSGWTIALLALLMLIAIGADLMATALGTKLTRASRWAFVGAAIGAIAGLFFGLIGIFIFPFVGAVVGELIATQNIEQSTKAGFGAWLGLLLGVFLKLALVFTMLGVFALAYFAF